MKKISTIDWIPGIESETKGESQKKSILFSILVSFGLFLLLPLSEFVRDEEWIVREVDIVPIQSPPPLKTKLEKKVEELIEDKYSPRPLEPKTTPLMIEALSANLEVGPGDFKAEFNTANEIKATRIRVFKALNLHSKILNGNFSSAQSKKAYKELETIVDELAVSEGINFWKLSKNTSEEI